MRPRLKDELVTLAHGAGGKATRALVEQLFLEELSNPLLDPLGDSALLDLNGSRLAFTTDSYVVKPIVFPGGDIGELAVNGTVNDLAVAGARPVALSAGFVIEEGFEVARLRELAASMARAAERAGVPVATGDTKVVERGKADGLYVNTAGIGVVPPGVELGAGRVEVGDRVLVSGTLGDHGMAVMIARGELQLEVELESDTAPVHELAASLLELGGAVRWLRDPTRGGLATALNELAQEAGLAVALDEASLPLRPEVVGACEILGIDPLYVANEGKLVAVVAPEAADDALARLRAHQLGAEAALIGEIRPEPEGLVVLDTAFGGGRIVDMLVGDPLPRIC
ncbi:MAG TPA: hydrogenase expression/formation protein HypE [Gaiellaceae bacterium]|nr:hydrogenase expression/formation protein HypE [Gaiellaceae bacterium]HYA08019.1 hydrogenase expression/formation protein HypE [Gaiellaceae bacterium]